MTHHAKKSPSGSKRWGTCPGSIGATPEGYEDEGNAYSAEGTLAHELLEQSMLARTMPKFIKGSWPQDMVDHITAVVDYVNTFITKTTIVIVEKAVYIPIIGDTGTLDIGLWDPKSGWLHVMDLKYGAGYPVEAKENSQLRLYGHGLMNHKALKGKVKRLMNHIMQPRAHHHDGPFRVEEVTPKDMGAWEAVWWAKSKACDAPDAPRVPSVDGCRYCPARAECPALRQQAVEAARMDFKAFMSGPVEDFNKIGVGPNQPPANRTDLWTRCMAAIPLIQLWMKAVQEQVLKDTAEGKPTGYKLVEGKSNRMWNDTEAVKAAFKKLKIPEDAFMPRELVGIGAGEKLVPAKVRDAFMKRFAKKPPGKPTLVPESDPRSPINNAKIDFALELDE